MTLETKLTISTLSVCALCFGLMFSYSQDPVFSKTPHSITLSIGEHQPTISDFVMNAGQLKIPGRKS